MAASQGCRTVAGSGVVVAAAAAGARPEDPVGALEEGSNPDIDGSSPGVDAAPAGADPVGAAEEGSSPGNKPEPTVLGAGRISRVEAVLGSVDAGSVGGSVEAASVVVVTTPLQDGSSGQGGVGDPLKVIFWAG